VKAIIFDIDGTLANVSHRLHHLDDQTIDRAEQWKRFFAAQSDDTCHDAVAEIARAFARTDTMIVVVSARPETHAQDTKNWLLAIAGITFDRLYMREEGDFRPDHQVKADILQQILDDGIEPFLVIDDRPEVVEMWRSHGITTLAMPYENGRSKYAGQSNLTMLIGPSGAGKSTYIERYFGDRDVISTDKIRLDYYLSHSPEDLKRTFEIAHAMIKARVEIGLPTVFDATNIRRKDRLKTVALVPSDQLVTYLIIDRRLDEKLKDKGTRSEELVLRHHRTFVSQLPDILAGDNQPNVIVLDKRQHKV
jgi:predicted kinase